MSFTVQKDNSGRVVRKSLSISTEPPQLTINESLATSFSVFTTNTNTLTLNNTLVTASADELDKTIVTPGIATENKIAVLDENRNITNFNNITCSSITINGKTLGSNSGASNQFLNNITPGSAEASKALVLDSNKNLTGINNIKTNKLTIQESNLLFNDNYYYNQFIYNSINNDNNWVDICWADNLHLFVAISNTGSNNRIMTSPDGITWTSQISPADYNWTSICWSSQLNLLVAVSSSGTGNRVMTSSNGINWTLRNTPVDNNWTSVCWSNELNLFVTVSNSDSNNNVMTSSNGILWQLQSTPNNLLVGNNSYNSLYSIEAGGYHSLFLLNNGNVLSCGRNDVGQLGDGTTVQKNTVVPISTLSNVISVSAGLNYSLALLNNGIVKSWGQNTSGQLGNNSTTNSSLPVNVLNITNPIAIFAGSTHALALLQNGTVSAWGSNNNGQIGDNTTTQRNTPVTVFGINNAIAISAGLNFSLALLSDGTIKAWGLNTFGQLGDGTTTQRNIPVFVSGINNAVAIYASSEGHAMALLSDGTIRAWGRNNFGQLGNNTTTNSSIPVTVSGINTAVKIKATSYSSFALLSDGTLMSWGYNNVGQLGNNTTNNSSIPIPVLNSSNVIDISCGYDHSIALHSDGTVKTWGLNTNGQLGDNTTISKSVLTNVLTSSSDSNQLNNIRTHYTSNWNSVCWSSFLNLFVAVGSGDYNSINRIMTSTNGINWTLRLGTEYNNWTSVCWAPAINQFIAVANSGNNRVMTSVDGINWKTQLCHNNDWIRVVWSDDFNVAVAICNNYATSKIMYSTNGSNWIPINTNINKKITSIAWSSDLKQFCLLTDNTNPYRYLQNWELSPAPIGSITAGTVNNITNFCRYVEWIPQLNLFIVVGGSGKILTSPDGINWTARTSPNANLTINSITYSPTLNLLVAVGNGTSSPYVLTSTDGISWVSRNGSAANNWISVTWGNGLFVAISQLPTNASNAIMTSPDGINWTSRSAVTNGEWWKVRWVPFLNRFIAIGTSSACRLMSSVDGINWIQLLHNEDNNWKDFAFSSNLLVAVSDVTISNGNPIMTSNDGITWTSQPAPLNNLYSIIWSNELQLFIAMSFSNNASGYMYSSNGKNWVIGYTKINQRFIAITWSPSLEKFISVSTDVNNENIIISNSGLNDSNMYSLLTKYDNYNFFNLSKIIKNINYNYKQLFKYGIKTWFDATNDSINNNWNQVIWVDYISRFYITGGSVDNSVKTLNSSNGNTWTINNANFPNSFIGNSLAYSNELNITVCVGNGIYYMLNAGPTWSLGLSSTNNWKSVCWASDLMMFVAVSNTGTNNRIVYSSNGINWTLVNSNNNDWNSICWSSELQLFVAVASSGTQRIMISSNGINWSLINSPNDINWNSVCWSPELELFVAVASSGTQRIMTSPNGLNWTLRNSPENNNWNQVIWIPDLLVFVAIASSGTNRIMYSFDGIIWKSYNLNIDNEWTSIAWASRFGSLILVSNSSSSNRILRSQFIKLTDLNTLSSVNILTNNNKLAVSSYNPTFTHQLEYDSNFLGMNLPTAISFGNFVNRFEFNWSNNFSINISDHNGIDSGLALNNELILATGNQINSLYNTTPGIANNSKALVLDSSRNISGINNLSCNNININSIFDNINEGIASSNSILITNSNNNISNINTIGLSELNIKNTNIVNNNNNNYISNIPYALTFSLSPLIRLSNVLQYACWSPQLSIFVGVTNFSTSLTYPYSISPDGYNWNAYNNITNSPMRSIAWSPVLMLFVGVRFNSSTFYVSNNGTTWSTATSPYSANWISITWSNAFNKFFAIAQSTSGSTSIVESSNGFNWVGLSTPDNSSWEQIIELNNQIICVANTNLLVSTNGIDWNLSSFSTGFSGRSIAYSNTLNLYVMVGINGIAYSSNLSSWTSIIPPVNNSWIKVIWISELNLFVAISNNGTGRIIYSYDGVNWFIRSNYNYNFTDIVWSPELSRMILLYTSNQILVSNSNTADHITDFKNSTYNINMNKIVENNIVPTGCSLNMLNNWISRTNTKLYNWSSICRGNSLFVAVASSGDEDRVITSPDGITWTSRFSSSMNDWTSVIYSKELNLFVAVASSGDSNRIMTSTNAIDWSSQVSASNNDWTSVCWSKELNLFVAVASSGTGDRVMTSPDGITWTSRVSSVDNNWTSICWSKELNLFVAVASSGTDNRIMTSPDGISWTSRTNPLNYNWKSVCWCPNINTFIAVADSGTDYNRVMTSNDGINWSIQFCNNNNNWKQIIWVNEMNLAVAISTPNTSLNNTITNQCIMTSSDGFNWSLRNLTISNNWSSLCWASDLGIFCAISNTNFAHTIMTYPTQDNAIIAYPNQLTINNVNGRVGLGISSPNFQLHLSNDSAFKLSTSTWTVSSDRRLKNNIQNADLDECYNNIKNLPLKKYKWKDDIYTVDQVYDRSKLGWLADDVQNIFPKSVKLVNAHGFEDCKTMNSDQIIASLYGCIQKLMTISENKKNKIIELQNKFNEYKNVIDNLEIVEE